MKKILYITRNELYSLFYSPIAWLLMILFIVLTGSDYIDRLEGMAGAFERGGAEMIAMKNLTKKIATGYHSGYFAMVIYNLYIFLPLLTMGLISREVSSGTIKLLHSSPLRIRDIVMGKYLAIVIFTLCLLFLVLLTVGALCFSITSPDYLQLAASLFGLFMILSTYSAIGLFISSLTPYQVAAAIITLAVFALFSRAGTLWQDIDIIRGITYYLNIGEKSANFVSGLLNLRDFTYFLIIIGGFLMFTIIKIKSGTESISTFRKVLRYSAVVAVGFILGYVTSNPHLNVYYDATRNKINTITLPTQAALKTIDDGELEITAYSNLLDNSFMIFSPFNQNYIHSQVLEQYIRFKPDIKINYVYYYNLDPNDWRAKSYSRDSLGILAEKTAGTYGVSFKRFHSPEEIKKQFNVDLEGSRSFFLLKYKGKQSVLRTFYDSETWPGEDEVAAAIYRLVNTAPKLYFLSDEIERGIHSYQQKDYQTMVSEQTFRHALVNQGYDVDTLSLKRGPIPSDISALVIADPRTAISPESIAMINNYIDAGGNLLLAIEPDRKELLRPLLDKLGITYRDGMILQPTGYQSADYVLPFITKTALGMSPALRSRSEIFNMCFGDTVFKISMPGAGSLSYKETNGFTIEPLLYTDSSRSWSRSSPVNPDSLNLKIEKATNDESGSFPTALRMHRKINGKEQRIIVTADADYLSKAENNDQGGSRFNQTFSFATFSYFSYGKFPANTQRPHSLDNRFTVTVKDIRPQKIFFYWIVPIAIGIASSVLLIRRKRK